MTRTYTRKHFVEEAAKARCNLNIFYGVIGLLEAGTVTGERAQRDAERIVRLCKEAAGRQLAIYDRNVDVASHGVKHG